jgi:hypothetical protein
LNSLASRLRIVDVIRVIKTVLAIAPVVALMLWYHAMLVTSDEIGFVEGFAHLGAGIEIGLAAPWIPFVVGVRRRCRNDHLSASG